MVCCLGMLACGGKQKTDASQDEELNQVSKTLPPKDDVKPSPRLTLGAFRIFEARNPEQAIEMTDEGAVMVGGQEVARVNEDGSLIRRGVVMATLKEDGRILSGENKPLPMKLDANGVATMSGVTEKVYFGEDGSLVGQNENAPKMASEGCTGEVARACMFVLLVTSMPVPSEEEEEIN